VVIATCMMMNDVRTCRRDIFGRDLVCRYYFVYKYMIKENPGNFIFLEIRDTREHEVFPSTEQASLSAMLTDPLTAIENKWEPFQSYAQSYLKEMAPFISDKVHFVTLTYIPQKVENSAALNFHLTSREKQDLYQAIYHPENQAATKLFLDLLNK